MEFIRRFKFIPVFFILVSSSLFANEQGPHLYTAFEGSSFCYDPRIGRYRAGIWHNHPEIIPTIQEAKRNFPNLKAFMYRELFCVLEVETDHNESVGNYKNLPDEWFQKDLNGKRIEVPDYPGRWVMDIGNTAWQDYWIQKTLKDVKENGWDGVFADDALTSVKAHDLPPMTKYSTDESYQQAFTVFLERITEAFHKENKLVIANASNTYDYPGLWEKWLNVTDGLAEEHFSGEGWTWGGHVAERQMKAFQLAHRKGKFAFAMTYRRARDLKTAKSSLAAFFVVTGSNFFWSSRPFTTSPEPFQNDKAGADLLSKYPLGSPLQEAAVEGSIWSRKFEAGFAAVNTSDKPASGKTPLGTIRFRPHEGKIFYEKKRL